MNFIKQIEVALIAINQARFQDLINHFLHIQGATFIGAPGSVVAKEKTSKGAPDSWVAVIRPGAILYEITGVSEEIALKALRLAGNKLPFSTKVITKRNTL